MRILFVHARYRDLLGGEEGVVRNTVRMLRDRGHEVEKYWRSNEEITRWREWLTDPVKPIWSTQAVRDVLRKIEDFRPDLVHVHNTWAVISPAVHRAASRAGVPSVQELQNYRLMCANGTFIRDGEPCELCKGKPFGWPGVRYACYKDSTPQSLAVATVTGVHHALGTWHEHVDLYLALTEFARARYVEGGFPEEKIAVKPNFVPASGHDFSAEREDYALFAGRLTQVKGTELLAEVWSDPGLEVPLRVAGDGPEADRLEEALGDSDRVSLLGWQESDELRRLMRRARFLVFPSIWYEGMPLTVLEAFSEGCPVVAASIGALEEMVSEGETGILFESGSPSALREAVERAWEESEAMVRMGKEARRVHAERFDPDAGYDSLMRAYGQVTDAAAL